MTWGAVQALGSGALDFRLVIEGYPYIFCTDGLVAGAQSDGRERAHGLMPKGIRWSERQHFVEPVGRITGFTVDIADDLGKATAAFTSTAAFVAWMNQSSMLRLSNNVDLTKVDGLSVGDVVHVGSEAMEITTISGRNIIVDRGVWDTQAVKHSKTVGAERREVEFTDVPVIATGRRVWVYAHGRSELATSDSGTLVYKGIVSKEPKFDGTKWSILVDPITKILDQEIGVDRDGIALRGIYYGSDLRVVLKEHSGASRTSSVNHEARIIVNGYFETQADFLADLQGHIDTSTSSWTNIYTAVTEPDGSWTIVADVDSSTPVFAQIMATSNVDGTTEFAMRQADGYTTESVSGGDRIKPVWADPITIAIEGEDGESTIKDVTRDVRQVPRASYRLPGAIGVGISPFFEDMAEYGDTAGGGDDRTIYLYGIDTATAGDTLSIDGVAFEIDTVDAATGEVNTTAAPDDPIVGAWMGGHTPDIGLTADIGGMTDFGTFISTIVDQSADRAAELGVPFFRSDDFDEASIQAAVDEAKADLPPLQRRSYAFHEAKTLRDVINQELLAHGMYFHITTDWKIGAKRIRSILNVEHDLTEPSDRAASEGFGTVAVVPDVVNTVEIKTGYRVDPEDGGGEHAGQTYRVREVRSQTRMRQRRKLEIAPEVVTSTEVTRDEAQRMAMPYTTLLGHRYEIYTLPVPLTFYDVLVGDSVRFSVPQLASDGRRGISNAIGLVVGQRWSPAASSGELTLLRTLENVAGYAPSALVSGWSLDSGTIYDLTTTSGFAPSGADASFFETGFEVALVEWDGAGAGRKYRGTVTGVSGTTISAEFQVALPSFPANSRWTLGFEHHQECTDAQRAYVFVADLFYRLSNSDEARVLGP